MENKEFEFCEGGKEYWDKAVEVNSDGYGNGILNYAKSWALMMEKEMKKNGQILTDEIKSNTEFKADVEGITGFMYNMAVQTLVKCWKHGKELQKLHNKKHGVEDDTVVVNSSVLVLQ